MDHKIKRYGWIRDRLDQRDFKYAAIMPSNIQLPPSVDLRNQCPPIFDQGDLGSCTANALAGNVGFIHSGFIPSRLFIYFDERAIEHTISSDSGAQIRDGIKSLSKQGVCSEDLWPYDVSKFTDKPTADCYKAAKLELISSYHALSNDLNELKTCLAQGFPFVMGISVYSSFESASVAKDGIIPIPSPEDNPIGGHALMVVGYDDSKNSFLVRNSWGENWGISGYCYIPYEYITNPNLASDFWTIRS